MKWIGLTGGIASGKSTVVKLLQDLGKPVVDADQLARQAVAPGSPGLAAVTQAFGPEILTRSGELDRRRLGQIVFADPQKLARLEAIVHPEVQRLARAERARLESQGFPYAFYDVPLLFEKNLQNHYDAIVVVTATEEQQRRRMRERDGLSEAEISNRLARQLPLAQKAKAAHFVIDNSGTLADLKHRVGDLLAFIEAQEN